MARIILDKIHFYAYHGCLVEESKIGSEYELSISVEFDMETVGTSDDLSKAIDYCLVTDIALNIAQERHQLLETIVYKIAKALLDRIPNISGGEVALYKMTPPINARVNKVGISHDFSR